MQIFLDDVDCRQFVYLLGEVMEDSAIECLNYCLMLNHYHLTIRPSQPNLSAAMRKLDGWYGQWWNHRHGRVGHVFQGRFKDQIVDCEQYLLTLTRYVALNPVRAGLVTSAEDWRWSSYGATAGLVAAPSFLATAPTLRLFGPGPVEILQDRFIRFINDAADDLALIDRIRSNERILGPRTFKDAVRACGGMEPTARQSVPLSRRFRRRRLDLADRTRR